MVGRAIRTRVRPLLQNTFESALQGSAVVRAGGRASVVRARRVKQRTNDERNQKNLKKKMVALRAIVVLAIATVSDAFYSPPMTRVTTRSTTTTAGMFDFLAFGKAGASHILLPPGSSKARYIKEEIEKGKMSFASAAKEFSECPSGQKGGDLGTFGQGQMVGAFNVSDAGVLNPCQNPRMLG